MTDTELATELHRLKGLGPTARNELQAILKDEGGWSRLIGLIPVPKIKRPPSKALATFLPDEFPDERARANAVAFWNERGRGDLAARLDEIIGDFRAHHGGEAHNTRAKSWPGTWTTWYRNQHEFKRLAGKPVAVSLFDDATTDGWVKRLEIFHGLDDAPAGGWLATWGPKPGETACRVPAAATVEFHRRHRRAVG